MRHLDLFNQLLQLTAHDPEQNPLPFLQMEPPHKRLRPLIGQAARILLAEDNTTNQQVALGILSRLGLFADAVASGEEALQALRTIPYDLVLMDVQMPVMDGMEATRRIRNSQDFGEPPVLNPQIPIIAMTAHAMSGDRERFLQVGMDDYVAKPVSPQALAEVLACWLPRSGAGASAPAAPLIAPQPTMNGSQNGQQKGEKPPVFNPATLHNALMGDEELIRDILGSFLESVPDQVEALQAVVEAGDLTAVHYWAHTLKGASATVGGESLRTLAEGIEQAARTGSLSTVQAEIAALSAEYEQLAHAIQLVVVVKIDSSENAGRR